MSDNKTSKRPLQIILLNGPPKSGKDLIGLYLYDHHEFNIYSFGTPIVETMGVLFPEAMKDGYRAFKETIVSKKKNISGRDMMISFAEEFIKPKLGKGFFATVLANEILKRDVLESWRNIVICDLGFDEEFDDLVSTLRNAGLEASFEIWHISRPGCSFIGDSRNLVWRKSIRTIDIVNDESIDDLYAQVDEVLNR